MYIKQMVQECDMDGIKFGAVVAGAAIVARGATGRWCVVLECGPEYLARHEIVPEDADMVRARIDAGQDNDWGDF